MTGADAGAALRDALQTAMGSGEALYIAGGGSKSALLGRPCGATPVDMRQHRGIVTYRPEEMVLTARAGTPVAELQAACAEHGQRLPCEVLLGGGAATLGGTVASGLSGPARPWRGAVRDAVLGLRLLNGRAELLRFGGEVMKNVAGYDVSRLQCGALGTLGLICDVSLRLVPIPERELFLRCALPAAASVARMRQLARRPLPLSGACWHAGIMYLRLEGSAVAIEEAHRELRPEFEEDRDGPWEALREYRHPAVAKGPLVCADLAPASPVSDTEPVLIDWCGARRYFASDDLDAVEAWARRGHGHAQRLWAADSDSLPAPPQVYRQILQRLKHAMDPQGLFNPGRLYAWL